MDVAVIDIGKPGKNLGWAIEGANACTGTKISECVEALKKVLEKGPLALGFEAPMFVPKRDEPCHLTKSRSGECVDGVSRPFSAGAGSTVLVTALVVVPYVLIRLKEAIPSATPTFDWRSPPTSRGEVLFFEAFVTNQKKSNDERHIEDAGRAARALHSKLNASDSIESAVDEPDSFNLLGAMSLRFRWTTDLEVLSQPCLVVRP